MDKRRSRIRNNRKRIKNINWSIILKVTIGLFVVILATFFSILNIGNSHIINNIYIKIFRNKWFIYRGYSIR